MAQPAVGAADLGLLHLLWALEVRPAMVAGHSYGEYVALCAADCLTEPDLYAVSEARGRFIAEAAARSAGTMVAVTASVEVVEQALSGLDGVWIANVNAPRQTVVSGSTDGMARALKALTERDITARTLPVACAFHSPLVAPARERLGAVLGDLELRTPRIPVYSNASAAPYPTTPGRRPRCLPTTSPSAVRFAEQVEAMYEAGARIFVEVGPRNVLTGLVGQILGGRPHLAVACDAPGRPGLLQLQLALGQLYAHGVQLNLDRLHRGRGGRELDLNALADEYGRTAASAQHLAGERRRRAPAPGARAAGCPDRVGQRQRPLPDRGACPAPGHPARNRARARGR